MPSSTSELNLTANVFPNRFIRAGAGAGKTTTLIRTFFDFVEQFRVKYKRFPRVIMTTFTRKATQEVKERLLINAVDKNDPALFEFINKKSQVHISTIHGVLSLFLSRHHEVLGLPSDLKVVDAVTLRKKSFRELKNILKSSPHLLELLEQYSFRDLLKHLEKLIDFKREYPNLTYVDKNELQKLFIIKTKKAAQIIERVLSEPIPSAKSWTEYFGYLEALKNSIEKGQLAEILEMYSRKPRKPSFSKDKPPFDPAVHSDLEELMKDFPFTAADSESYLAEHEKINKLVMELVEQLDEKLWQQKLKSGEISISDLELFSLQLIRDFPSSIQDFSKDYDYFMIDEYQDTSPLQVKILNALTLNRPHFIVGDPQQSIYLFRGARSEVFTAKESEADEMQFEKIILDRNYRTTPRLMTFINDFFNEFSNSFLPMQTKSDDFQSVVASDVYYIQSKNEIYAVLNQIQRLNESGVKNSEICVLCRKNGTLLDLSQEAHKFGIPVQLQVAAGFDEKREILDLVFFLRFLTNPHDSENLIGLLRSPWFSLSDSEIIRDRQSAEGGLSYWSQLRQSKSDAAILLQNYLEMYFHQGVLQALLKFIEQSGLLEQSYMIDSSGKREANIWKFVQSVQDQMSNKSFLLNEFISSQFNQLQSDLGSSLSEGQPVISPDRVSLMTIHSSKGLEFNHVIVIGLADNPQLTNSMPLSLDPTSQRFSLAIMDDDEGKLQVSSWAEGVKEQFNQRELAESERLLYVAMTRAKTSLTLVSEDRERIWETSWFKKIRWFAEGLHDKSSYVVHSITDTETPRVDFPLTAESAVIRPRLNLTTDATESTSITEILDKNKKDDAIPVLVKTNLVKNLYKAQKGTDLHRLFESLKYNESWDELSNQIDGENQQALQFLARQQDLPLKDILDQGFVEWGFGLQNEGGTIQGQIDAWAILGNKVYILDYKTGSPEYLAKAYEQLRFYAACLYKMKIITNHEVFLGVIYPLDQKVFQKKVELKEYFQLII